MSLPPLTKYRHCELSCLLLRPRLRPPVELLLR